MSKKKSKSSGKTTMRAIKIRIYPDKDQIELLVKTFGCCRYIWNHMLSDEQYFYAATDQFFIPTPAKYKNEAPFLKEVDSLALANVQINLKNAFNNFFAGDADYPNFKSKKKSKDRYTTNRQGRGEKATIRLVHKGIHLPIIGDVKACIHRTPMPGWRLKSATVSRTKCNHFYCSLQYEFNTPDIPVVIPTEETTIGLDYSSPKFYVDSNGNSPDKERFFRVSEKKLALLQRRLSRMKEGSNNYNQQLLKVEELHEHIANQRKDFTHKESRRITNSYNAVCVEDINLRGMAGSLRLGKSTNDNGFGMFRNQLSYKLAEKGKHLIKIDKWFPSTKTCGSCGTVNKDIAIGVPEWTCPVCGTFHDRDKNAACNIKEEGLRVFFSNYSEAISTAV